MKMISIKTMALITTITISLFPARLNTQASVLSYTKDRDGVTFKLDKGAMKVNIWKDDLIEVKYTTLSDIPVKQSLVVNKKWTTTPEFKVTETLREVIITTGKLMIKVGRSANSFRFTDLNNVTILAEYAADGKKMTAYTVAGINTYSCETGFISPFDEALFGLGCHPEDSLSINYKGRN
jgi:alpha-D-xyloside xylohydrolase